MFGPNELQAVLHKTRFTPGEKSSQAALHVVIKLEALQADAEVGVLLPEPEPAPPPAPLPEPPPSEEDSVKTGWVLF
jgi:hypothetical protein